MERITVEIDHEIIDLIPGFLKRKRADLEKIREALTAGDFAAVAAIAHRIKGEGGAYGFDQLSEFAKSLERAAKSADGSEARSLSARMAEYIEAVEVV